MRYTSRVKIHHIVKQLFPALVIFGLTMGCGGDKDTEEASTAASHAKEGGGSGDQGNGSSGAQEGDSSGTQKSGVTVAEKSGDSGAQDGGGKAADLAEFLSGKRLYVDMGSRQAVLQFEKDGKFDVGVDIGGKIMSVEDGLTYKVSGPMKVTTYEKGKEDGGVTFPTAHPKKGDKIKFGPAAKQMDATITKFGDTSPMASGPGGG